MDLQIINVTEGDTITTIHLDQMDNGLINMSAISELLDVLRYIEDESKCKFIVFRGSKACFGRGLDIKKFYPEKIDYDGFRKWEKVLSMVEKIDKVTVAVIDGDCFGAAIDLALTCDIRVATEDAKFSHDEIKKNFLPGQTIFQLGKFCGLGRMMELIQTGRVYTANEATQLGIVNGSYDASKIEDALAGIMDQYRAIDINVLTLSRRLAKESYSTSYDNYIGGYLAAQHRVAAQPGFGRSDDDDAN
jgi:enoyl-CoA hydratase/carnithine racemase